jgi:hypothetical protein
VSTPWFGALLIFFLNGWELAFHGFLFILHGALVLVGSNSGIPILLDRGESLRGSRGRLLKNTNGTTLVKTIGAGFSIVNPDISDGQIGVKIDILLGVVDNFLDRKRSITNIVSDWSSVD